MKGEDRRCVKGEDRRCAKAITLGRGVGRR